MAREAMVASIERLTAERDAALAEVARVTQHQQPLRLALDHLIETIDVIGGPNLPGMVPAHLAYAKAVLKQ